MGKKLSLDVDRLRVTSFETGDAAAGRGTVRAEEATAACGTGGACISNTNCFTTPCCPVTVTCPPPTFAC